VLSFIFYTIMFSFICIPYSITSDLCLLLVLYILIELVILFAMMNIVVCEGDIAINKFLHSHLFVNFMKFDC